MNQRQNKVHALDPAWLRLNLPDGPGVYIFRDQSGKMIYVGKAKSLKKRVLSYFNRSGDGLTKTAIMMNRAMSLDYFLTATEKEALILESSLVKKHMPRYNVVLRDDKQYPCLRLDLENPYPRLTIVRRIKKDGALYYGPFSSAQAVRSTLKLIDRIFQLRKCKGDSLPKRTRPCLNYQLDRCLGACVHEISVTDYKEVVKQVRLFLEGRNQELLKQLKRDMTAASESLNFENAARIRDQINAVEKVLERQDVVSTKLEDRDVIGLAEKDGAIRLVVLFIRKGYLTGSRDYRIKHKGESQSEVIEAFLKQFYSGDSFIPKEILISRPIEDHQSITDWISDLAGRRIIIHHPLRGEKRRLVEMAETNAENLLAKPAQPLEEDLLEMAVPLLKLKKMPRTIEGLDISNIQGDMAVGAVVSFVDGHPNRQGYRNYRIRNVEGIDDYGMMSEVVERRLSKNDPPDLFVIDGGKGHLMAVKKTVDRISQKERPDLVSLAKARGKMGVEKIFIPGRKNPISINQDHPLLHLLMRIRDEAHRRAVTHHRKRRKKDFSESILDRIPGIGAKKKNILLKYFGSIESISNAKLESLVKVPGINQRVAQNIYSAFTRKDPGLPAPPPITLKK